MSLKVQVLRFLSDPAKFTKFMMSFMKTQVIFLSKFESIFSIMAVTLLYVFNSHIIYFVQKNPVKLKVLTLLSVESKFAKFLMAFFKAQVWSCHAPF